MRLVRKVSWNFPGLETEQSIDEHKIIVLKFMNDKRALCVKDEQDIVGVLIYSRKRNMICCLAVDPAYRKNGTGAAAAQRAIISEKPCGSYKRKWREWRMRNSRLLPYETIVQATSGEPEAVNTVLQHYRSHIRYAALVNGQIDQDTEDYITQTLLTALFKFRFEGYPRSLHQNLISNSLRST